MSWTKATLARSRMRQNLMTSVIIPATMADVAEVEVVVAHHERATVRVGDVFLKIDADQTRTDIEVETMAMAPIPTPKILWREPLCSRSPPCQARLLATSGGSRPRRRRPGPQQVPPRGCCTMRRRRPGPGAASTSWHRTWTANAGGWSPTACWPPTWSRATAGWPRLRFGRGHRCSPTATCRPPTCSSR